jgi:hypothetical protein
VLCVEEGNGARQLRLSGDGFETAMVPEKADRMRYSVLRIIVISRLFVCYSYSCKEASISQALCSLHIDKPREQA